MECEVLEARSRSVSREDSQEGLSVSEIISRVGYLSIDCSSEDIGDLERMLGTKAGWSG